MVNTTNGNVGIGTFNSAAKLEVNGFTKLGSDAPAIKFKKLTGTTAAAMNLSTLIPHGLTNSQILSVSVLVQIEPNIWIPNSYTSFPGYDYSFSVYGDSIRISNSFINSGSVLSKPVKILITYEE